MHSEECNIGWDFVLRFKFFILKYELSTNGLHYHYYCDEEKQQQKTNRNIKRLVYCRYG